MEKSTVHVRYRTTLNGKIRLEMAAGDMERIHRNLGFLLLELSDPTIEGLYALFGRILDGHEDAIEF